MNNYCLTINIRSQNEALLNNLIVTLETLNDNLNEVDTIEMFTAEQVINEEIAVNKQSEPGLLNKEIYLDTWMVNEE